MNDFIGIWDFHSCANRCGENGVAWLTAEEYLNSPMDYIDKNDPDEVAHEKKSVNKQSV